MCIALIPNFLCHFKSTTTTKHTMHMLPFQEISSIMALSFCKNLFFFFTIETFPFMISEIRANVFCFLLNSKVLPATSNIKKTHLAREFFIKRVNPQHKGITHSGLVFTSSNEDNGTFSGALGEGILASLKHALHCLSKKHLFFYGKIHSIHFYEYTNRHSQHSLVSLLRNCLQLFIAEGQYVFLFKEEK